MLLITGSATEVVLLVKVLKTLLGSIISIIGEELTEYTEFIAKEVPLS